MYDSSDSTLLTNRISDAVYNARERYMTGIFGFSDEKEQSILLGILKSMGFTDFVFWGGYTDAERKCLGIFPDTPDTGYFPISFIRIDGDRFSSISHRDCMGTLLGCGIKREILGDIVLINEHSAYAAVFDQDNMADYLSRSITRVGRATVKCSVMPEGSIPDIKREFENLSFTVSAMRIDSIVAGAVHTSRSAAVKLINEGLVTLNHLPCTKPDRQIKSGDVFSVHRKGKFVVEDDGGLTKKDKIRVNIKKYL